MLLNEAIDLIRTDIISGASVQIWADLGCGSGTFTEALANLLPENSIIYAVDRNKSLVENISGNNKIKIEKIHANFINDDLPQELDGILMANSIHYVEDKDSFIKKIEKNFKSKPFFLIVEYDMDISNPWVPFPLSFNSLKQFFTSADYTSVRKLNEHISVYQKANIYSAIIKK
jgi:ubiquinone/menaquinone biosynthesis C-methylase UbiE